MNSSILRTLTLGLGLLALPNITNAQWRDSWGRQSTSESRHHDGFRPNESTVRRYNAVPRSSFTLTLGTGYAGRGYYYGPPGVGYYYQRPGVTFYRSWNSVPNAYRHYGYAPRGGNVVAVQQALARMGYYGGRIDGDNGPGTRRAIVRFEERHGLPVTGQISGRLLNALNLR